MPGKSKHGKGKRPQNRNRVRQPAGAAASSAASGNITPAAAPAAAVHTAPPRPKATGAKVSAKNMVYVGASKEQYPFFTSELKGIGIITAIILVVLVVLGIVIK
jgi:hypothetical protein